MSFTSLDRTLVARLAPNARAAYLAAFDHADEDLLPFGINAAPLRLAHFMAQVSHETDGLSIRVEAMNYSAGRLPQVWPSRFADPAVAAAHAHAPEKLANFVYGGRMGNTRPGDGWRFIGRGLLQITGRTAYETYGGQLGIPLAERPDLAFSAEWALKIAAAEWAASGRRGRTCNELADADDLEGVTIAINGGRIGLAARRDWLGRWKRAFDLA